MAARSGGGRLRVLAVLPVPAEVRPALEEPGTTLQVGTGEPHSRVCVTAR